MALNDELFERHVIADVPRLGGFSKRESCESERQRYGSERQFHFRVSFELRREPAPAESITSDFTSFPRIAAAIASERSLPATMAMTCGTLRSCSRLMLITRSRHGRSI